MYVCLCKVCIMWSAGIVMYCYVLHILYVLCVSVFRTAKLHLICYHDQEYVILYTLVTTHRH